jgi:D-alanyl-lipoteichoic acid acyltransferase DltB (MBOAT superfamily)
MVIADNCAEYANQIFNNHTDYSGGTLVLGALFFTFQIYCDFSGYSDIALGTARLFGIELLRNFAFPYFSRDIAEFWRRWHISLSSWFRDYVYIPLGGSRGGKMMQIRNTMIIFLLSGFWHGANWTFIVWGGLNALYFLPLLLRNKNRQNMEIVSQGKLIPSFRETGAILTTFALTVFAWIFFRASSLTQAFDYIAGIFSLQNGKVLEIDMQLATTVFFTFVLFLTEWINREKKFALEVTQASPLQIAYLRRAVYVMLVFVILICGGENQQFIYFQF